jgi:hypothetical protein
MYKDQTKKAKIKVLMCQWSQSKMALKMNPIIW